MSCDDLHPAALNADRLLTECEVRRQRRSGPGGQHRNKVETAVILTHTATNVSAEASERRSQGENRQVALFRLRVKLALKVRRPVDPSAGPSNLWQSRCRSGRILLSPQHDDYPTLLAEALDVLATHEMDVKAAAKTLGCTPSQLTRFLKTDPRAIGLVNKHRQRLGLRSLQ